MKIYTETSLTDFDFWSGARDTVKYLTYDEMEQIEAILEDIYPDGMTDTQINDIFWFEDDWIAEMLGYEDFEAIMHRDDEEEDEEEEEEEAVEDKKSVDEVEVDTEADVAEVEEESFNRLGERFLKRTYENVDSFKLNDAVTVGNTLQLEGVIRFKSGKERSTRFILEAKDMTPEGRVRFIGENKQLCTAKKAFTVSGKLSEGKFIAESLNYNYSAKDKDGKSTRVYGTVSNRK